MITSESSNIEIHHFFDKHRGELLKRLYGLLFNKHRRAILSSFKRGAEIPPYFGMLKLPEATLYAHPIGIKPAKVNFQITSLACFMVIKDLREQTPVLITDSKPHVIMYSAHAVRRYKERMGLDPSTEFIDVCKHMILNGCINTPRVYADMSKIYGTNIDHRELSVLTMNGAYKGFADGPTKVFHAETFLSTDELRDDQLYLNASKSEDLKLWRSDRESFAKGEISSEGLQCQTIESTSDIAVSDGKLIRLSPEEARLRDEENRKAISDPEYLEKAKEENRKRYNNKVHRKGFK